MKFSEWELIWRKGIVDLRPSTLARDEGYVQTIPASDLRPHAAFGNRQLLYSYMGGRAGHQWSKAVVGCRGGARTSVSAFSAATIAKAGQILGKILSGAVTAGKLRASPCVGIKFPRIEHEEMRFLSPSEVTRLADAIAPPYKALVILGAYGGLRIGEMLGLKAGRVDLLHSSVDVFETLTEVSGHLHTGPPKTKAGRRRVPLPKVAIDALRQHLLMHPAAPDDYVFRSPDGTPTRVQNWRNRVWIPAVDASGLVPLRPHDLRHTAVALWIAAGASPVEIARRAGHASVATVLDRYGHLFPGSENKVNDALDILAKG